MLVDDSAIIRGALSRILKEHADISVVASCSNGEIGVKKAGEIKPHIAILDVEMPVMDGLTALPKIIEASPETKVIMFSTLTDRGADITMKAMSLGAVECLVKPSSISGVGAVSEFQTYLLNTIRSLIPEKDRRPANTSTVTPAAAPITSSTPKSFTLRDDALAYKGRPQIVAIGSSTGGPQALFEVLQHCTNFSVPIIITQHMPATFTRILAEHIQQKTGIPSHEGENGMILQNGHAYVAPGGFHMLIHKDDAGNAAIKLDTGPPVNFCKPSVDPMFNSAIDIYGNKVLGIILTGMGSDGIGGGRTLVEKNGRLVAQDEKSSVVWGMPGAVAMAGLCSHVLPLQEIGPWIKRQVIG